MISNQPTNIVMSSINNLLGAKQAKLDGSVEIEIKNPSLTSMTNSTITTNSQENVTNTTDGSAVTPQSDSTSTVANPGTTETVTEKTGPIGLKKIHLNFDSSSAESGNSSEGSLSATLTDESEIDIVKFNEVMLKEGKLYLKISGLEDFFTNYFGSVMSAIPSTTSGSSASVTEFQTTCVDATDPECVNSTDTIISNSTPSTANTAALSEFLSNFGSVISIIDDQWLEINIDDVMNSRLLSSMPDSQKQEITETYNCFIEKTNNLNKYSAELSEAYSKNPFLNMTPGKDSYYNISLDTNNLKNYVDAVSQSKFSNDLKSCSDSSTDVFDSVKNRISQIEQTPTISAKFEGLFSHHITDLKISDETDSYSLSSNLKFTYPNNLNVSAPSDARPIMEVVEEIFTNLQGESPAVVETVETTGTTTDSTTVITPVATPAGE